MPRDNGKRGGAALADRPPVKLLMPPLKVSYPAEGDTISHPTYTIQIATEEPAAAVDICIDEGEWRPCRESLGLWWFDWGEYDPGEHEAVARLIRADGTFVCSEPRIFYVKLS